MRIHVSCIIFLIAGTALPLFPSPTDFPYLVWSDEFSNPAIDTAKWSYDTGTGAPALTGWGNNELEYYTNRPENARIVNGSLVIEALKEAYRSSAYTSARMKTKNKGDWTYGRIEIRAKLPSGQGLWPAIWMLPTDNFYGGWAASGEIDIMEERGQTPSQILGTIHYGGAWPNNTSSGGSHTLTTGTFADTFHVFAIEWGRDTIRWYVDTTCFSTKTSWYSSPAPFPAPFDKRFHLILNVAVGGNFLGNPDPTTAFPQRMTVDYVRVYAKTTAAVAPLLPRTGSAHDRARAGLIIGNYAPDFGWGCLLNGSVVPLSPSTNCDAMDRIRFVIIRED
jgi:beta-glucanase (GH16 family)